MRIESLHVGQIIKNYRELCTILEINYATGNSRIAQHKEIERYIKYDKQGHKYIINEIYQLPKDKEDNRGGNNTVFTDDFKKLIIHLLHNKPSGHMIISKGIMYKTMNLVNENYLSARNNIRKLSEIIQLPQSSIYEFYDNNSTKIRETVERNLRRCRSESIIMHENVTCVAIYEAIIATNEFNKPIIDSNGRVTYSTTLKHREATEEEKHKILEVEDRVKNSLGCISLQDVFLRGKWREFKKEVERILKIENTNIQYYYEAYKIYWNDYKIKELYNELCKNERRKEVETNINNNMIESIKKSTMRRHDKACVESGLELNPFKQDKYFEQEKIDYVIQQEKLTMTLISQDAKDISEELRKLPKYDKILKSSIDKFNEDIPF